jgi:hypothetical protein
VYWLCGLSSTTLRHITQLFENAGEILAPFSEAQIGYGLDYLIGRGTEDSELHLLSNETIPLADRQRCVRSIFSLFQSCFAKRCSADSYQLSQASGNPLDYTCYGWWDSFPSLQGTELRADIREVRQRILSLGSMICRESVEYTEPY